MLVLDGQISYLLFDLFFSLFYNVFWWQNFFSAFFAPPHGTVSIGRQFRATLCRPVGPDRRSCPGSFLRRGTCFQSVQVDNHQSLCQAPFYGLLTRSCSCKVLFILLSLCTNWIEKYLRTALKWRSTFNERHLSSHHSFSDIFRPFRVVVEQTHGTDEKDRTAWKIFLLHFSFNEYCKRRYFAPQPALSCEREVHQEKLFCTCRKQLLERSWGIGHC